MKTENIARLGILGTLVLVLSYLEKSFPLAISVPGIKLGLANSLIIYVLLLVDTKSAIILLILKVFIGSFIFSGPVAFAYSLTGSTLSLISMAIALYLKQFSVVGISVIGSFSHISGQLLVSRLILGNWLALSHAPILMVSAVISGVITGVIAQNICKALLHRHNDTKNRLYKFNLLK